jgi:Tfp pilus assembly protein PilV
MSTFKKLLKSQSGFSVAEVMVAAGMLGVLSLGVTQLMQNMNKSSNKLKQDAELLAVENLISSTLLDADNCTASFRGITLTGNHDNTNSAADVDEIVRAKWNWTLTSVDPTHKLTVIAADDGTFTTTNSIYGSGASRVRVLSLDLAGFYSGADSTFGSLNLSSNYAPNDANATDRRTLVVGEDDAEIAQGFNVANLVRDTGTAYLRVVISKQVTIDASDSDAQTDANFRRKSYGSRKITKFIPLTVTINGANQIESCSANSDSYASDDACGAGKLIRGTLDTDSECKNVEFNTIANNDPAVTIQGNTVITDDAGGTGNLGIGTNNPTQDIHAADGNAYMFLRLDGVHSAIDLGYDDGVAINRKSWQWKHLFLDNTLRAMHYDGSSTSWSTPIVIEANGNVGIGTENPDQILEVAGADNANGIKITGDRPALRLQETDGTADENMQMQITGGDFQLGTNNDAFNSFNVRMTMNQSGNVGIGTTDPGVPLQITNNSATLTLQDANSSNTPVSRILFENSVNNEYGRIGYTNTNNLRIRNNHGSGNMIFDTGGTTERMRISSGGSVSIGTSGVVASSLLSVQGTISSNVVQTAITDDKHVTTVEWVKNHVGEAFAPSGAVSAVVGYIDNMNQSQAYEAIKSAICGAITINGAGTTNAANCDFRDHRIDSMSVNNTTSVLTWTDMNGRSRTVDLSGISTAGGDNCSNSGECSQICIGASCKTDFPTTKCPPGEMVIGIHSSGHVLCAHNSFFQIYF